MKRRPASVEHLTKSEIFLRCREKTCCTHYAVYLAGDEIVRVARTLDAPPWTFTMAVPSEPADDAFALDHTDLRYRAALTKLPPDAAGERCIFLLRLSEGTARCGLGESRPMPCRTFPVEMHEDTLRISAEGCTCRTWSLNDVDPEADRALLLAESRSRTGYAGFVRSWNAYVGAAGTELFTYQDFCRFLLDQYAAVR
jgi:Fe-S-cluster containining protein